MASEGQAIGGEARTYKRMDGRTEFFPHSTGLCPLPGPLHKKDRMIEKKQESKEGEGKKRRNISRETKEWYTKCHEKCKRGPNESESVSAKKQSA